MAVLLLSDWFPKKKIDTLLRCGPPIVLLYHGHVNTAAASLIFRSHFQKHAYFIHIE